MCAPGEKLIRRDQFLESIAMSVSRYVRMVVVSLALVAPLLLLSGCGGGGGAGDEGAVVPPDPNPTSTKTNQ